MLVGGLVTKLCLTLAECSPPGSSVHGIFQARILEWTAISFSRGSSRPRNQTQVSCIAGRFLTNSLLIHQHCFLTLLLFKWLQLATHLQPKGKYKTLSRKLLRAPRKGQQDGIQEERPTAHISTEYSISSYSAHFFCCVLSVKALFDFIKGLAQFKTAH